MPSDLVLEIRPLAARQANSSDASGLKDVTVDAVVAATALDQAGPLIVLTSDPGHLTQLTNSRKDVAVEGV